MKSQLKLFIKKLVGLKPNKTLSTLNIVKKYRRKYGPLIYKQKYDSGLLLKIIGEMGVKSGDNVFIHASWDEFYNYEGTVEQFVHDLIDYIGPQGTIAMPAIPIIRKKPFNLKKSVTKSGIIAETFRNQPDVVRSANVRHSVCAIGPLAQELVSTHHLSKVRFDQFSPFYKMCKHNFKVLTLGLPTYFLGTVTHCVEATMYDQIPYFSTFYNFNELVEQKYIDYDGLEKTYLEATDNFHPRGDFRHSQRIIKRYFDKTKLRKAHLSNLQMSCSEAGYVYERLCQLAHKDIFLFVWPKYKSKK